MPTDYLLYSNYERLVEALLAGEVDIGWNTNTAYVAAEHRIGGDAQMLGMRDVDADFRTVIVTRRGEAVRRRRASWPASGSRSAAATPATPRSCRCTTSPGRASTSSGADARPLRHRPRQARRHRRLGAARRPRGRRRRGRRGRARRCDLGGVARRGSPPAAELEVAWRSPTYYHCNFTALPSFDRGHGPRAGPRRCSRWATTTRPCARDGPRGREALAPGRQAGYADLTEAMREQGCLAMNAHRVDAGHARARRRAGDARRGRARERRRPAASSRS